MADLAGCGRSRAAWLGDKWSLLIIPGPERLRPQQRITLTEGGAALRPILEGLADWSHTHLKEFHDGISSIR